jgi:hypothetical protein
MSTGFHRKILTPNDAYGADTANQQTSGIELRARVVDMRGGGYSSGLVVAWNTHGSLVTRLDKRARRAISRACEWIFSGTVTCDISSNDSLRCKPQARGIRCWTILISSFIGKHADTIQKEYPTLS